MVLEKQIAPSQPDADKLLQRVTNVGFSISTNMFYLNYILMVLSGAKPKNASSIACYCGLWMASNIQAYTFTRSLKNSNSNNNTSAIAIAIPFTETPMQNAVRGAERA